MLQMDMQTFKKNLSSLNVMGHFTFMCELDLQDSDQITALCTSPYNGEYLCQFILKTV